jgi:hypothetical protein
MVIGAVVYAVAGIARALKIAWNGPRIIPMTPNIQS